MVLSTPEMSLGTSDFSGASTNGLSLLVHMRHAHAGVALSFDDSMKHSSLVSEGLDLFQLSQFLFKPLQIFPI